MIAKTGPPPIPGSGSDHILDHIQIRTTWIGRTQGFRKARFSGANTVKRNKKDQKNLPIRLWVHEARGSNPEPIRTAIQKNRCPSHFSPHMV